jgi:GT2 family glycosyltransferase
MVVENPRHRISHVAAVLSLANRLHPGHNYFWPPVVLISTNERRRRDCFARGANQSWRSALAVTMSERTPSLSVVVCTLNRCDALEQCLRSLSAQTLSTEPFETIVVDNGSSDDTRRVTESARARLGNLRYVLEPRLGLSHARNRGLAAAAGTIVAYLDDDATADQRWAQTVASVWAANPDTAAVGGRIHVRWPGPKPEWMPSSLEGYFGECDYGSERRYLAFPQYPYGSNMAFRRDVLVALGGFDERLGARGRVMMAAEETDLFLRLAQRHGKVLYEPAAIVEHWPPAERVTRRWSLGRAFRHGVSNSLLQYCGGEHRREIWAQRVAQGAAKSSVGVASAGLAFLTRRESSVILSRSAHSLYWAGFAFGSFRNSLARHETELRKRRRLLSEEHG